MASLRSCAALLVFVLAACGSRIASPLQHPAPTDPRGGEGEGERNIDRERYIERLHKTAPGDDWRVIEAENHERERQRRVDLVRGMPGGSAFLTGPTWEEIGSRNQAGHTRCGHLGPDLGAGRSLYVGSANGGVWRSDPTGGSWRPISDHVFGGTEDVFTLAPAAGTEPVVVFRKGTNVYRSDDGGATWDLASGLTALSSARRLLLLADAGQTLVLAARSSER